MSQIETDRLGKKCYRAVLSLHGISVTHFKKAILSYTTNLTPKASVWFPTDDSAKKNTRTQSYVNTCPCHIINIIGEKE
jgi:hypothetical protein